MNKGKLPGFNIDSLVGFFIKADLLINFDQMLNRALFQLLFIAILLPSDGQKT